jgi:hypothetical protein
MVSERKCMWSCYDVRGLRRRQRLLPFPRYSCVAPSLRMLGTPRAQREPCLRCSASAQMQRCCLVELPASSPSARHRPRRISTRRRGPGRPGMSIFFRLRPGDGAQEPLITEKHRMPLGKLLFKLLEKLQRAPHQDFSLFKVRGGFGFGWLQRVPLLSFSSSSSRPLAHLGATPATASHSSPGHRIAVPRRTSCDTNDLGFGTSDRTGP